MYDLLMLIEKWMAIRLYLEIGNVYEMNEICYQ